MRGFVPATASSCSLFLEWFFLRNALPRLTLVSIRSPSQPAGNNVFPCYVDFEPMDSNSHRPGRQDNTLSTLNVAIETLNLANEVSIITPAKAVFGSASIILTMIRVGLFLRCLC
jgi:hypothetical protein